MKKLISILLVAALALGCYLPTAPEPVAGDECRKRVHMVVHGDTWFTPTERATLERAAMLWGAVSGGRISLRIVWDLDVSSPESLRAADKSGAMLLRLPSDTELYRKIAERMGDHVVGLVSGTHVFLIHDKIPGGAWLTVATHEFGHLVGLAHVADENSIMSPSVSTAIWPTKYDLRECQEKCLCP